MKSVTILGYSESFIDLGTVTTDELWGMNDMWLWVDPERFTRWFDLHDLDAMYGGRYDEVEDYPGHLEWLSGRCPVPLYLFGKWAAAHDAIPFPAGELVGAFGRVFANSAAWLVGYALHEGFTRIVLRGWGLEEWYEKAFERWSVAYMVGVARGRGVVVEAPEWMTEPWLYGLEQDADPRWRARRRLTSRSRQLSFVRTFDWWRDRWRPK